MLALGVVVHAMGEPLGTVITPALTTLLISGHGMAGWAERVRPHLVTPVSGDA